MSLAPLARHAKRPQGFCVKVTAVAVLGLCFIVVWSIFSSPSTSVTTQRESFDDINEPVSEDKKVIDSSRTRPSKEEPVKHEKTGEDDMRGRSESDLERIEQKPVNRSVSSPPDVHQSGPTKRGKHAAKPKKERSEIKLPNEGENDKEGSEESEVKEGEDGGDEEVVIDNGDDNSNTESETNGGTEGNGDLVESVDSEGVEKAEGESEGSKVPGKKRKAKGPVFDPKARWSWKICRTRSKHNYIPCIDNESGRFQSYRHSERSCPRTPPMCLVPLPRGGYGTPVKWPESKMKMVPDIEWGKNIRVVLDIGCTDSSFAASLLDKDVIILSLGLKDDLVDLAQVALERGFPTIISPFATRRLPFPSMVFDAIHCGGCNILWHHRGGRLLLEMNRILRPSGYFILSSKHESIEEEEAMSTLTASICWNILAHKTDEVSEVGVKVYQKPESNDIYELRRKKNPPLCKESENPNAAW
ncbi:hypothetical protein CRG98_034459 [Punica granatum]|uniref:Methyltransferase n=1 Tax=Punica granatum TaxID=22663 RepID=A0A2I0IMD9_PUNGR|nr:hypothetical protein CRG98_034459 [Punica granatum]